MANLKGPGSLKLERQAEARRQLGSIIGTDGLAVIPAGNEVIRNRDVAHPFRQESTFWYLTGFGEADAIAVIAPGHEEGDFILFVPPRDPSIEAWTGRRVGVEGATSDYGADTAYEIDQFDAVIERLMVGREVLWYETGNVRFDSRILAIIVQARQIRERMGVVVPSTITDLSVVLGQLRLFKDEREIESLRRACRLTAEGHKEAMRFAQPGLYEYQVQAALEYFWRLEGSPRNGYGSIVAAGANACILPYEANTALIGADDLVLIDAGAEIDGYSADISRTFPANGAFTAPQRALYEIVLAAQRRGVELSMPGSDWGRINRECVEILTEGMVDVGLLPGPVERALAMHHYAEFFMHGHLTDYFMNGTSHWLGLDVHDRGADRLDGMYRPLEPGMAFTMEPAMYISASRPEIELTLLEYDTEEWNQRRIHLGRKAAAAAEAKKKERAPKVAHQVPAEFLGVGIRIEDDILITPQGYDNLTETVPKKIDEIEALCEEIPRLPRAGGL